MKNLTSIGLGALLSMAVACTAQSEPSNGIEGKNASPVNGDPSGPAPAPGCTPLPKHTGTANPAAIYCIDLGYAMNDSQCAFPDGTSCEEWSFYRGECGQAHSFCNRHGGTVANKLEDMGTWTASYAVCTLEAGTQCQEDRFAHACSCE